MASKSLILFCFLLATLLLVASARDLSEKTEEKSTKEGGLEEQKWYPGGGYPVVGYPWYPHPRYPIGGHPGGWYHPPGFPGGWQPGGGRFCRFGCCYRGYYGFCQACCPYPGAEKEAEPGN